MNDASPVPSRLARQLGTFDAVVIGMGAMIGAGIFTVPGLAARAAGSGMLCALLAAAAVAYCNAVSSAQLAARHPESGGAYVYGRERLGRFWGFLAGWAFVVGKTASCAAMALTFANYAAPSFARPLACVAVLALTAMNCLGVRKTALLTHGIVVIVVLSLALVMWGIWMGGEADARRLLPDEGWRPAPILQAAALWFFAFAGYARIATLGEEVKDPARTIPRAIPLALGCALLLYALVAASVLAALDRSVLAQADAPLAAAVEAGALAWLAPVARAGAAIASLGVLLSLLAGVGRTVFAMAADRELPRVLAAVHPRYRVPHRAELSVGAAVTATVAMADLSSAIGFSAFTVLVYYAVANASALNLAKEERLWPRWLSLGGLAGCAVLACSLPVSAIAGGTAVLAMGTAWFFLARRV